jgi:DNA primase
MTLSPAFLDELRARTTLSALVGRSVKLTKAGREHKACCPFHNEKTPSFYVNDEKGFYHCFGCQAHGDAIRWLTDQRGLPFMDAVKELADAAGIEVPAPDPRAQAKAELAAGLYEVMEAAQRWFEDQLGGIEGAGARAYLERRGISDPTRRKFGFGYAPDARGKLRIALKDYGNEKLLEAGLLIQTEGEEREPYDRFRGRLMFPIRDRRGRVIAFSARILGAGEPKYLNSPDTPLFDKGRTLFNIDKAAAASREAKRVIVVEGQMDVIALDQAGIGEAVAPLGTALTETQLGLLWRLAPNPLLCFDGDAAGQKAAYRAALRALPHVGPDRSLAVGTQPAGPDPDDLLRGSGRAALDALIGQAEPLVERLWRHEREAEPLATPEQKAGLRRRLLDHAATISDPDVRDQYRAELMQRFSELTRPPQRPWTPGGPPRRGFVPPRPVSQQAKSLASLGIDPRMLTAVFQGLLHYPQAIAEHGEAIASLPVREPALLSIRDELLGAAMSHAELDPEQLHTILAASGAAPQAEKLRQRRGPAFSFTRRDAEPERALRDLVLVIETLAAQPGIDAALEAATARLKEEGDDAAFVEQQRLLRARGEAERQLAALVESASAEKTEQGV